MAGAFNDFSQYTVGAFPGDWHGLASAGGYPGGTIGSGVDDETHFKVVDLTAEGIGSGKALKLDSPSGSSGIRTIIWDAQPVGADQEIYYEFYCSSSTSECQGVVRADIVSGTWYQGGPRSGDDLDLNKYINKSISNLANDIRKDWINEGHWQRCRFRVNGSSLYVKIWDAVDNEPAGWDVLDTDTDIASGKVGIVTFRPDVFYVRNFGLGTNGDPAPTGPASGGTSFVDPISPIVDISSAQSVGTNAGHVDAMALVNAQGSVVTLNQVMGFSAPVTPVLSDAQSQILSMIAGMVSGASPITNTASTVTLGLTTGVSDELVAVITPVTATAQVLALQARIGQLLELHVGATQADAVPLELHAGNSVQLAPASASAAPAVLDTRSGFAEEAAPSQSITGTLTLTARTGQLITLGPAQAQYQGTQLQLLTGVIIGSFLRSSIVDRSPRYGITDKTPRYSIKEVTYDD